MLIQRSIIKIGSCKAITLPKELAKSLNPKDRVLFEIKILEVLNDVNSLIEYRCRACEHRFTLDSLKDDIYCPSCNNENCEQLTQPEENHDKT
jgi:predicted Zn-ribbon and HTH transcriptional regulator